MGAPRLAVPLLCAAALAAAVAWTSAVEAQHERSGQADLTRAARALTDALSAPRIDTAAVSRLLAADANLDDPRVRRVLQSLATALRAPTVLARVTVSGERQGTAALRVLEGHRFGLTAGEVTLSWVRRPDGRWGFDPLPR